MGIAVIWPLAVYCVLVIAVIVGMIGVSYVLGERRRDATVQVPYESGIVSTGTAGFRHPVRFYLVAMFFVIFDVESIFVFAWAVAFRELGWTGYVEMLIFVVILLSALIYLWRLGALDWRSSGENRKQDQA